ncbi:modin [Colletotrichum orchidophilum]|uniref:Modin n=1 Tax=Colletotrichum orchidophilum TaxID=1209926 RepID=A0A1G4AST4_9PEZI|nr:modin [Colletotrichum orchidophilum]OHE92229.1 modin [Colletotrichum orchidophilum]
MAMEGMSEAQFNQTLQQINDNINDDDKELFVAIVALVISIVALLASLLQVAQQYFASAAGYSSCGSKVIGKWSESKQRKIKFTEFRFEVLFEAPVIFLCPPTNKKGPVKDQPIIFIDGSEKSLLDSRSELRDQTDVSDKELAKQSVHTADNERASWVALLSALQKMEHDSREWQKEQYKGTVYQEPPKAPAQLESPEDVNNVLKAVSDKYTLTVAVQKKRRSWDTMPTNVKKPYATTAWCHMVEMLAMLGVYWVEFNRTNDRYRAEGNGYTVTGEKVSDLGIMFTFQVHGRNRFENNRVIPVDETKELCFGFLPTIYRATSDNRRLKFPNDEPRDLSTLNFASNHEIAETLVLIGCNTNTVNYFSTTSTARVGHLFPVAFEIVGMLGRTLHIEKSAFHLLPNPTHYRWDTKNFSLTRLLDAYTMQMNKLNSDQPSPSLVGRAIRRNIRKINGLIKKHTAIGNWPSLPLMDALHEALDDTDEILTARAKISRPTRKSSVFEGNAEGANESARREMVQDVLRSHIQEVLGGFNEKSEKPAQTPPGSTSTIENRVRSQLRFEDIDAAPPELKQEKLMEVYFRLVRRKVVEVSRESSDRREQPAVGFGGLRKRNQTNFSTRTVETIDDEEPIILYELGEEHVTHEDIWCTLVFRMICWLMLHDFHKKDVQVSKSELLGSRLPVYIS